MLENTTPEWATPKKLSVAEDAFSEASIRWHVFNAKRNGLEPHLIPYQIVNSFSVLASPAINVLFGGTFFFSGPPEFQTVMMVSGRAKVNVSLCFPRFRIMRPISN